MSNIKQIDASIFENKLNKALFKCALAVENKAKDNVPVKSGNLRRHIGMVFDGESFSVGVTGVPYAKYVEYGTVPMVLAHGEHDPENPVVSWKAKTDRGAGGTSQSMPFLRTALFTEQKNFAKIFKEVFK